MKEQVLTKRYAQGLINSIRTDQEFKKLLQQLKDFSRLLGEHQELKNALSIPFLPLKRRIKVAKEILTQGGASDKIFRFILLLLEHHRLPLLDDILELMPVLWDEKKGICYIEVISAVPLTENQKKRLKEKLELWEKKSVALQYKVDPDLLGGFMLRKKDVIYDVSLQKNLDFLKEKISQQQR